MLTKLEVSGFKNLLDVSVEFGPFTCIAGPNGVGKSNLFDAISFLSFLADMRIVEACQRIRTYRDKDSATSDPRELFWTNGEDRAESMSFAAEMIVPAHVTDDFGRAAEPSITFLRYEIELGYEEPDELASLGRLVLRREELKHINKNAAHKHLRFPHSKKLFRDAILRGRRAGKAFISTTEKDGITQILTHQDGGSRGQPRPSPAYNAPQTIVSTTTTSFDPTILAARREMQSWRMLALEPSALRAESTFTSPKALASDGAHLASTLYRLATTPDDDEGIDPASVYSAIANRLSHLIEVRALRIDRDERRHLLTVEVREGKAGFLPARALSDGTLRFLALCIIAADPTFTGVVCMEEPENGIHPARLEAMVKLVRGLAVDPNDVPSDVNPLRQVIINTHSPGLVSLVAKHDPSNILVAKPHRVRVKGATATVLRLRPLMDTWRCDEAERGMSEASILPYLTVNVGGQVSTMEHV